MARLPGWGWANGRRDGCGADGPIQAGFHPLRARSGRASGGVAQDPRPLSFPAGEPSSIRVPERAGLLTGEPDDPRPIRVRELPRPDAPPAPCRYTGGPCGTKTRSGVESLRCFARRPTGRESPPIPPAGGERSASAASSPATRGLRGSTLAGVWSGAQPSCSTLSVPLPEGYERRPAMSRLRKPSTIPPQGRHLHRQMGSFRDGLTDPRPSECSSKVCPR